jgi:hypothetical protein
MLEKYERPMTEEERARLAEPPKSDADIPTLAHSLLEISPRLAFLLFVALCFGALGWLIGFGRDVASWRVVLGGIVAIVPIFICLLVALIRIGVVVFLHRASDLIVEAVQPVVASEVQKVVADGRASVCRISAVGAIVIEESKYNSGWIVIHDLGDGTSFWIWQEEFPDPDAGSFIDRLPQKFEIVRTTVDRFWLGLANCEGKLEPELRLRGGRDLPAAFFERDDWPESESLLPGRPRDVLARLGYQEHGPSTGA